MIYNVQFRQVRTEQERPLTPVWNIPRENRKIGKESLLIGNQRSFLRRLDRSRLFCFSHFAQIPGLFL